MFARVVCPACQYKDSIPEGDMGKRLVCPNCKSPYLAGKSIAEADVPMKMQAPPDPGFNKTMLVGDNDPPIRFNCPRCKKPQEAPASEAGTKKPCAACGQRLQVPAAPTPAAAQAPNLNKTLLASDESAAPVAPPIRYNCPTCKKPLESPASEAGVKKPCPACGQRLQVPAAPPPGAGQPNLNKTILASDESRQPVSFPSHAGHAPTAPGFGQPGQPVTVPASQAGLFTPSLRNYVILGGGALFLLALLACVVPAFIRGGKVEDSAAMAAMKAELDKLKKEIEDKKVEVENQKKVDAAIQKRRDDDEREYKEKQRELEFRRQQAALETNAKRKAEEDAKIAEEERKIKQDRADADAKRDREAAAVKAQLDEATRKLNEASQRQVIIQQAPPVVHYYDPWDYRYYRPWWAR